MLNISANAFGALAGAHDRTFSVRVLTLLADEYKVPPEQHDALLQGIEQAIVDAKGFGLVSERSVATYCLVAFLAGLEIRDDPKVKGNLGSPLLSEAGKVAWLEDWMLALEAAFGA